MTRAPGIYAFVLAGSFALAGPAGAQSSDAGVRAASPTAQDAGRRRWRSRRDAGLGSVDAATPASAMDAGVPAPRPPRPPSAGPDAGAPRPPSSGLDARVPDRYDGGLPPPMDGATPRGEAGLAEAGVAEAGAGLEGGAPPVLLDASVDGAVEDAGVDAGPSAPAQDAAVAPVAPAPTPPPFFDPWEFFGRSEPREDREPASSGGASAAPIVTVLNGDDGEVWDHVARLVPSLPSTRGGVFALLALIVASWFAARWFGRVRARLPDKGVLPRALSFAHITLRIFVAFFTLVVVAQLLPDWARPVLPWVLVAGAIALGWSARDVLPDLVAGAVLFAERRLTRGEYVRIGTKDGGGYEGVVHHLGVRVTTLRDAQGHLVRVPNRVVLATPVATRRGRWHEVRVSVRAPLGVDPAVFGAALREAALLSPWAPIPTLVSVSRDPSDASQYELVAHVVHARYAERFRGELLSRAESLLAQRDRPRPPEPEAPPPSNK